MEFLGLLTVSPFWGIASPRLFLKGWLAFLGILALAIAFFRARLTLAVFAKTLFHFLTDFIFSFVLLIAGFYLLYFYWPFGKTNPEIIVYWIFSSVQLAFLLTTVSGKIDQILLKVNLAGSKPPEHHLR